MEQWLHCVEDSRDWCNFHDLLTVSLLTILQQCNDKNKLHNLTTCNRNCLFFFFLMIWNIKPSLDMGLKIILQNLNVSVFSFNKRWPRNLFSYPCASSPPQSHPIFSTQEHRFRWFSAHWGKQHVHSWGSNKYEEESKHLCPKPFDYRAI